MKTFLRENISIVKKNQLTLLCVSNAHKYGSDTTGYNFLLKINFGLIIENFIYRIKFSKINLFNIALKI